MELEQMLENIDKNTQQELETSKEFYDARPTEQPTSPEPTDVYQRDRVRIRDANAKSFPHGSSAIVDTAVASVIDGAGAEGLARAYKRAKDDSDSLKARGERRRAELVRKQYMQEYFLPAVEIVANSESPDALLATKRALEELDKYVLLEGSGRGYTAAYVRQAYGNQLGQVEGRSDDSVRSAVRKVNMLLDDGQIRTALGIAKRTKEQVDRGEHTADDQDYNLLAKVVSFYD